MVSEKPGLLIRFFYKTQPGEGVSKYFPLTAGQASIHWVFRGL